MRRAIANILRKNSERILGWSRRLNSFDSSVFAGPERAFTFFSKTFQSILNELESDSKKDATNNDKRDFRSPEMRLACELTDFLQNIVLSAPVPDGDPKEKDKTRKRISSVNRDFVDAMTRLVKLVFLKFWTFHTERLISEHEQQTRKLRMHAVSAQDSERKRLATVLHDDVIQSLASMLIETQMIRSNLNGKPSEIRSDITRLEQKIRDTMTTCRLLTLDMESFWLQKAGLLPALSAYLRQCENRDKITIRLTHKLKANVSWSAQVTTMHVIQEALNNVKKHARASSVDVVLECDEDQVYVAVLDNGKGFDADSELRSSSPEHLGLTLLCERLKLLNGKLKVTSEKGSGTRLEAWIPNEPEEGVSISERKGSAWIRPEY